MMKRSSLVHGLQKGSDVYVKTGEKIDESDDDCEVLKVIKRSEPLKRVRVDSSTISEGGFKSVSGTILGKQSSDLSASEPSARSGSLARSLPEQEHLETGEDETAAPRPSSSRTMSQENHPTEAARPNDSTAQNKRTNTQDDEEADFGRGERSDATRRRDLANRRSSSDDELSDLEENRGTKRAYEGERNKSFADSHHHCCPDHYERCSRRFERDGEGRSRRSRSSPRWQHERNSRGLDQDFDRGFGSESYEPRGNSRWKNSRFPSQAPDNTSPSRIHKNYISVASQSTQTEGSWIVSSSPRVEKEKDNVNAERPTTTQNYNVSSYCHAGPSNRDLTRRRPEVKDILQKLQNCPCCEFRSDRRETRKHLKITHKKELCLFCLPEIHCVVHRSVDSLKHFNKDHAFSEEYGRAKCPLCPNVFTYEGIYKHMSCMHFTPIEPKEPDSEED